MEGSILPCANSNGRGGNCPADGRFVCSGCYLVKYCGRDCQLQHRDEHKKYCKSPMMKQSWQPTLDADGCQPSFQLINGPLDQKIGGSSDLYGNVPAIDVLQLSTNEGDGWNQNLRLLFAASGDLRNVFKTISAIPNSFNNTVSVTLNDNDFDVVARNAIILLVAFTVENVDDAVDCIIHLWYSALIRPDHCHILQHVVLPLIEDVNKKIDSKPLKSLQAKTWTFGSRSLRLVLEKAAWGKLGMLLRTADKLSTQMADTIRTSVTLDPDRIASRECKYIYHPPAHRVCLQRFHEDGMLLPFGVSRQLYTVPNLTFFHHQSWPLVESADPMDGWDIKDVSAKTPRAAASDLYGKLFYYLQGLFKEFIVKSKTFSLSCGLFQLYAHELLGHVEKHSFTRIEVSNICDGGYLDTKGMLSYLGPLLQRKSDNHHATLIILYKNAVYGVMSPTEQLEHFEKYFVHAMEHLPPPTSGPAPRIVSTKRLSTAASMFYDYDHFFNLYVTRRGLHTSGRPTCMTMKRTNTIIEKWPLRLKKKHEQPGAQEEFDILLRGGHVGDECYVEWKYE